MADLPDYYTQAQISEAEAASFKGGLAANKSLTPVSRDIYLGTDNHVLYVCVVDGAWTGFDASILTKGILTLYENMVAGGKKITGLGAPAAQDDALRYNRAEIRNAEIAAAAAIAYSKLNLTGAIKAADIEAAAGIPLTKLEDAVCSETEADNKILGAAGLLTVKAFQFNPATGTASSPQNLNDNDTSNLVTFNTVDQYGEVILLALLKITQYRHWGVVAMTGNGRWKIQYLSILGVWTDWLTDIPIRTSDDFSNWASGATVAAQGIRLVCTTVDDYVMGSRLTELEVKY